MSNTLKKVAKDRAFHKVEFIPNEAMAKRIGSPAFAYVSALDAEHHGIAQSFVTITGLPVERIVRVHEGLIDSIGNRVELAPAATVEVFR